MNCNLHKQLEIKYQHYMANKILQIEQYKNYLIPDVHLVKFINATNTIVSKHQCTCLEINNTRLSLNLNKQKLYTQRYVVNKELKRI